MWPIQKQPPEVFYKKHLRTVTSELGKCRFEVSERDPRAMSTDYQCRYCRLRKTHRKKPVSESLFNKVTGFSQQFQKRNPGLASVSMMMLSFIFIYFSAGSVFLLSHLKNNDLNVKFHISSQACHWKISKMLSLNLKFSYSLPPS